jgi:MFS family permease
MSDSNNKGKGSPFRMWLLVWGLGLAGQLCWNIENQWFNTFVYAKIGKDPSIISGMLIWSAVASAFSTFFFGTWADRTGKRRSLIAWGYILWGIFTIAFGLTEFISKEMYTLVAFTVVMADTVMSFFGSMGSTAGFSTWTTDIMTDRNRGGIGAALATQPVLGTLIGTVVGGMLVGKNDNYMRLFIVMGGLVIVAGIISMFALNKNDDVAPHKEGGFWRQFFSVFNFKKFFGLKELVLVHIAISVFTIGFNIYFSYTGNYLIYYLGYNPTQMGIIEAVPLVFSMLMSIPIGILINKNKHPWIGIACVALNIIGLMILFPVRAENIDPSILFNFQIWFGIFVMGVGYVGILQVTKVWAKQLYPDNAKGQFEGIWTVFYVLIPMIAGALIGEAVVKTSGETFVNQTSGKTEYVPNSNIFLVGAIVVAFTLIPLILSIRYHKKRALESNAAEQKETL